MRITKNLDDLKTRISAACAAADRNATEVSVLAVSKRHGIAAIQEAYGAGLHCMGENYVQEALEKIELIDEQIEWHFIGKVQSNKTRQIAANFSWVHTVSSDRVALRLNDQRPEQLDPLNVCVQVNIDGSEHGGIEPESARRLCELISGLPRLRLRGLMAIPMPAQTVTAQRVPFRALRELCQDISAQGIMLDTLSMGMTADLEAAVLEGSTLLRIGTALFGPRPDADTAHSNPVTM